MRNESDFLCNLSAMCWLQVSVHMTINKANSIVTYGTFNSIF